MIEPTAISTLWKLFAWLPKFIMRRMFTKEKLSNLVIFDVCQRNEYAQINLGEVSRFTLHLQLINLSPVTIELEQAEIIFNCAGTDLKSSLLKREAIKLGEVKPLYVHDSIPSGSAAHIAKFHENNKSYISANLEFNCDLHNFSKQTGDLNGVIPSFINVPKDNA